MVGFLQKVQRAGCKWLLSFCAMAAVCLFLPTRIHSHPCLISRYKINIPLYYSLVEIYSSLIPYLTTSL